MPSPPRQLSRVDGRPHVCQNICSSLVHKDVPRIAEWVILLVRHLVREITRDFFTGKDVYTFRCNMLHLPLRATSSY